VLVLLADAAWERDADVVAATLVARGFPWRRLVAPDSDVDGVERAATAWMEADGADGIVGVGAGATQALIAACGVGWPLAVLFGPVLVHGTLDAAHPIQPIDLLPGLAVPVQAHVSERDPRVAAHHVTDFEERLLRVPAPCHVFTYAAAPHFLDPASPDWSRAAADAALHRMARFLEHHLGEAMKRRTGA
jgi:dienelactone hydrolase